MSITKPITRWTIVSVACSTLGLLWMIVMIVFAEDYEEIANTNRADGWGFGIAWVVAQVLLATGFCLLGILLGVVALIRILWGGHRGQWLALTGIVLGCLPWLMGQLLP